jgi:hypothetical protein
VHRCVWNSLTLSGSGGDVDKVSIRNCRFCAVLGQLRLEMESTQVFRSPASLCAPPSACTALRAGQSARKELIAVHRMPYFRRLPLYTRASTFGQVKLRITHTHVAMVRSIGHRACRAPHALPRAGDRNHSVAAITLFKPRMLPGDQRRPDEQRRSAVRLSDSCIAQL